LKAGARYRLAAADSTARAIEDEPPLDSISALTVTPTSSGAFAVASFTWSLDSGPAGSVTTSPYALTLDLASLGAGPHVVTGQATDVEGRASAPISMTLGN
jgi:hypothetical protein